jgi:hypothetical protein
MTKARDLANASTALSAVSATELAFVDGVTSAIQTQIDTKAPSSTAVTLTGTQTLTNKTLTSPALTTPTISTATTNGDILYGTGSGALARLGIGTTGQVLNVSAGVPAWATVSSGSTFTGCSLFNSATQSCATGVSTILTFDSERADSNAFHSTSSNTGRITIPTGKAGKYLFGFMIDTSNVATGTNGVNVYKNGTYVDISGRVQPWVGQPVSSGNFILDLAVADYIELGLYQQSGGNAPILSMSFTALFLGA